MSELRRLPRTDGPWFQQGPLIHGPDHGGFDIGPLLGEVYDEDDARYVVAAINALPDLLAERDRLEAALRTIRDASPQSFDWYQNRARAALRGPEGTPDRV